MKIIHVKKQLIPYQIKENLGIVLNTGKALGCQVDEITPLDIAKGKPFKILKLLSEILKVLSFFFFFFFFHFDFFFHF